MALRRAEQSREADVRYQLMSADGSHLMVHLPYVDGSTYPSAPIGVSDTFEPPIIRSPSPTSNTFKSNNEDSDSDDGDGDDNDDISSTESKDQNDHDGPGLKDGTSDARGLITKVSFQPHVSHKESSDAGVHRESNLLLQMVAYRPQGPDQTRSDRLISGAQALESGTRATAEGATDSVRLLLDKWTTSGSAPISNVLDEEATKDKHEASV